MMTQQLQVSILAAPLAAIDPRALSQAWYAALRLGPEHPTTSTISPRRMENVAASPSRIDRSGLQTLPIPATSARATCAVGRAGRGICRDVEPQIARRNRKVRSPLARAIEAALFNPRENSARATVSMGRGSARIVVMLQTKGNRTTLIALCRPELRDAVARALTQARLTLAARGIGVELAAKGVRRCS
ncbi:MAG TPA: hypothetical protein VFE35_02090 [Candidatus Cybelea sp.]|jgi:hypothetical protein|nr:hypothetical protein [Candidatus Cybelea sp.]